ncbi:unnamed protein product [Closterium sp. Naga37s-1]|nr:unnamed protein product [Closterium sp. Naga37s-1]
MALCFKQGIEAVQGASELPWRMARLQHIFHHEGVPTIPSPSSAPAIHLIAPSLSCTILFPHPFPPSHFPIPFPHPIPPSHSAFPFPHAIPPSHSLPIPPTYPLFSSYSPSPYRTSPRVCSLAAPGHPFTPWGGREREGSENCPYTAPSLPNHCPYTALSLPLHCPYTAPSLPLHCLFSAPSLPLHCSFTAPSLPLHCPFTAPTLPLHCPFTAPSLPLHCPFTAPSLLLHCPFTAPSLPLHCPFTAPSLPLHCPFTAPTLPLHCPFTAHNSHTMLPFRVPLHPCTFTTSYRPLNAATNLSAPTPACLPAATPAQRGVGVGSGGLGGRAGGCMRGMCEAGERRGEQGAGSMWERERRVGVAGGVHGMGCKHSQCKGDEMHKGHNGRGSCISPV